jgi:lipopolysaccharide biosynthesis regulator YciM
MANDKYKYFSGKEKYYVGTVWQEGNVDAEFELEQLKQARTLDVIPKLSIGNMQVFVNTDIQYASKYYCSCGANYDREFQNWHSPFCDLLKQIPNIRG